MTYIVHDDPSWSTNDNPCRGAAFIRRTSGAEVDAWSVSDYAEYRLHRDALAWRERHPTEPLLHPHDHYCDALPHRKEIRRLFRTAPFPSSRYEGWQKAHTFTLAEACYVCGVEAP